MKPGLCLTIVSLILAVFLSGCLEQREDNEGASVDGTIKIGVLQSLTGDLGSYGGPMSDAMKLAAQTQLASAPMTLAESARLFEAETAKYRAIAKAINLQPQ